MRNDTQGYPLAFTCGHTHMGAHTKACMQREWGSAPPKTCLLCTHTPAFVSHSCELYEVLLVSQPPRKSECFQEESSCSLWLSSTSLLFFGGSDDSSPASLQSAFKALHIFKLVIFFETHSFSVYFSWEH